jgi:hypothetical protein
MKVLFYEQGYRVKAVNAVFQQNLRLRTNQTFITAVHFHYFLVTKSLKCGEENEVEK